MIRLDFMDTSGPRNRSVLIRLEQKVQVICTTHSTEIFDRLPNDARFYVEIVGGEAKVTPGISAEYAFTKMSAKKGLELDVFVEDDIAKAILLAALTSATRARVSIHIIGSASVLARQLAACYLRDDKRPILLFSMAIRGQSRRII